MGRSGSFGKDIRRVRSLLEASQVCDLEQVAPKDQSSKVPCWLTECCPAAAVAEQPVPLQPLAPERVFSQGDDPRRNRRRRR